MSSFQRTGFAALTASIFLLSGCVGGSLRTPIRHVEPLGIDSAWIDGVRFTTAMDSSQRLEVGYSGTRSNLLEFKVRWTNLGKKPIEIDPHRIHGQAFFRRTLDPGSKAVPPRAGFPGGKVNRPALIDSGWEPMDPLDPEAQLARLEALRADLERAKNPYDTPGADLLNGAAMFLGDFDNSSAGRENSRRAHERQETKERDLRDWERERRLRIDECGREIEWFQASALRHTTLEVGSTLERSILVPAKTDSDSLKLAMGSSSGNFRFAFLQRMESR